MSEVIKIYTFWSRVRSLRWRWFRDCPVVQISHGVQCGPACLNMITKYYGYNYSLDYLIRLSNMDEVEGTSLRNLIEAADQIGFQSMAIKVPFRSLVDESPGLVDAPLPCILHWGGNFFVVLYRISNTNVSIVDPILGKQHLTEENFKQGWLPAGQGLDRPGIVLLIDNK